MSPTSKDNVHAKSKKSKYYKNNKKGIEERIDNDSKLLKKQNNNDGFKKVKIKEPLLSEKNHGEDEKNHVGSSSEKDEQQEKHVKKPSENQFGSGYLDDPDNEAEPDGYTYLDIIATPKVYKPSELDVDVYEGAINGFTNCKCSEENEENAKKGEDGSDNEGDESDTHEENNEPASSTTSNTDALPPQEIRDENHTDPEISVEEETECTSPVGEPLKYIMTVVQATGKGPDEPVYLPTVGSTKYNASNLLPDHGTTDLISLNATTNVSPNNGPLIDELPKEQETQDVNSLSELAVSGQTVKYPENEITVDGNAAMLLNVQNDEQIEAPTSIYAYFPGLAGPSGEMSSSYDNSQLEDVEDADLDSSDGSVSGNSSFQSGPADAYDPDVD